MNDLRTAYYDMVAIAGLMNIKNEKFLAVHVYSIFKDFCLIVYEINKDILDDRIELDYQIKKVRNRVHLYEKGNNIKIYNRIIDIHIKQFGNDIDNLGFYLTNDKLEGSTVYSAFIFQDTKVFERNPIDTKNKSLKLAKLVGETAGLVMEELIKKANNNFQKLTIPDFEFKDLDSYTLKDIRHISLYSKNDKYNVLITRLLLCLQEASTSIWLYQELKVKTTNLNMKNYILLRLISIKCDEIFDNLKNMQQYLDEHFKLFDLECGHNISKKIEDFEMSIGPEVQKLRNTLHYKNDNFLEYVSGKLFENPDYIEILSKVIVKEYLSPIKILISNYLKVDKMRSMSNLEKYTRRTYSIVTKKDFKSI